MVTQVATNEVPVRKAPPVPRNGVDTPKLFATIGAVAEQTSLALFQFRAESRWMNGTHTHTSICTFYGAGAEMTHAATFEADADHPAVLCGHDLAPSPVEWLLHGLAGCLTAGIANISAARGVTLNTVECSLEGDIDLQGILGLSHDVRNGFQAVRVGFRIDAEASAEKIAEIVGQAQSRSAVLDIMTNGVPVFVSVNT
jgi:uncharacterized OsmC-like protein